MVKNIQKKILGFKNALRAVMMIFHSTFYSIVINKKNEQLLILSNYTLLVFFFSLGQFGFQVSFVSFSIQLTWLLLILGYNKIVRSYEISERNSFIFITAFYVLLLLVLKFYFILLYGVGIFLLFFWRKKILEKYNPRELLKGRPFRSLSKSENFFQSFQRDGETNNLCLKEQFHIFDNLRLLCAFGVLNTILLAYSTPMMLAEMNMKLLPYSLWYSFILFSLLIRAIRIIIIFYCNMLTTNKIVSVCVNCAAGGGIAVGASLFLNHIPGMRPVPLPFDLNYRYQVSVFGFGWKTGAESFETAMYQQAHLDKVPPCKPGTRLVDLQEMRLQNDTFYKEKSRSLWNHNVPSLLRHGEKDPASLKTKL